jgi:hypothetical protein
MSDNDYKEVIMILGRMGYNYPNNGISHPWITII